MKTLDMRGSPCPLPVVNAKKELQETDAVIVLVDNTLAVQNLQKMALGKGYAFSYIQQDENNFAVTIDRQGAVPTPESAEAEEPLAAGSAQEGAVVLISSDRMGQGEDELGRILIKGFIFSLTELPVPPKAVIFINSGVRLAIEGSNTLADLQTLTGKGVKILACGTCLNYYSLTDKLAVGEVTNMMEIAGLLTSSAKLVTL